MSEIGLSTHAFAHDRLTPQLIDEIAAAGFDSIEIYAHKPHFMFTNPKESAEVINAIKRAGLKVNSIHCPFYRQIEEARKGKWLNITSDDEALRRESVDWIKRSIKLGDMVEIEYAVIHFGDINDSVPSENKLASAAMSMEEIIPFAKKRGIMPVLENIPNSIASCEKLALFLERFGFIGRTGICYDTGHAAIAGEIPEGIERLGSRIKTVHLHDTIDCRDEHLIPGEGILDWKQILSSLRTNGYTGRLVVEPKWGDSPQETIKTAAGAAKMLQKEWDLL